MRIYLRLETTNEDTWTRQAQIAALNGVRCRAAFFIKLVFGRVRAKEYRGGFRVSRVSLLPPRHHEFLCFYYFCFRIEKHEKPGLENDFCLHLLYPRIPALFCFSYSSLIHSAWPYLNKCTVHEGSRNHKFDQSKTSGDEHVLVERNFIIPKERPLLRRCISITMPI